MGFCCALTGKEGADAVFPKLQEVDPRANSHSRNIASESDLDTPTLTSWEAGSQVFPTQVFPVFGFEVRFSPIIMTLVENGIPPIVVTFQI